MSAQQTGRHTGRQLYKTAGGGAEARTRARNHCRARRPAGCRAPQPAHLPAQHAGAPLPLLPRAPAPSGPGLPWHAACESQSALPGAPRATCRQPSEGESKQARVSSSSALHTKPAEAAAAAAPCTQQQQRQRQERQEPRSQRQPPALTRIQPQYPCSAAPSSPLLAVQPPHRLLGLLTEQRILPGVPCPPLSQVNAPVELRNGKGERQAEMVVTRGIDAGNCKQTILDVAAQTAYPTHPTQQQLHAHSGLPLLTIGTSSSTSITSQGSRPGGAVLMVVVRAPPAGTSAGARVGGWAARLAVQATQPARQSGVWVHTITARGGGLLLAALLLHSPSSTSCSVSPSACSRSLSNSSSTPSPSSSSPSSPASGTALQQQQRRQRAAVGQSQADSGRHRQIAAHEREPAAAAAASVSDHFLPPPAAPAAAGCGTSNSSRVAAAASKNRPYSGREPAAKDC